MSDALDAIEDIKEALEEYGSNIELRQITTGIFNPGEGETLDTFVDKPLKVLIKKYNSFERQNTEIHNDDLKLMLYFDESITYDDRIILLSSPYKILNIDKKVLQNENLFYTLQIRA